MPRTVTIRFGDSDRTVTFGWATLGRIDAQFDESVYALGERLSKMTSAKDLRMDFIARFVAACLDIPVEQLDSVDGGGQWFGVFMKLVDAFVDAVASSFPQENGGAEGNVQGSQASEPGPGSSSASPSTNSTGSSPQTSESSVPLGSIASGDGISASAT